MMSEDLKDDDACQLEEEAAEETAVSLCTRGTSTLFANIPEANVTFCIDTSGSMYNSLDAVKRHLVEFLTARAQQEDMTFNLIEFNTEVKQWSDTMVRCTPETVAVAREWVEGLSAKTGTNILEALDLAFSDNQCDAICLVTDGYPDQHPTEILDAVGSIGQNRPVHCYYIQGSMADPRAVNFLQELAMETYGSFHMVTIAQHGTVERVQPVYRAEAAAERIVRTSTRRVYPSNYKMTTLTTTLDTPLDVHISRPPVVVQSDYCFRPCSEHLYHPFRYYYYLHPSYGWSRYRQSRSYMAGGVANLPITTLPYYAPGPGSLLIGTQILGRRMEDGLYYLGKVKSQILDHKFLVEFGPCKHGKWKKTSYQETHLYDIISYTDSLRHSILVGDKVLAPWEPEGERFGPGTVIEGQEQRDAKGSYQEGDLVVAFYNGKTATIPAGLAVWVPQELHERVRFELQLPSQVRLEMALEEEYPSENLPGYPTSGVVAIPPEYETFETVIVGPKRCASHRQYGCCQGYPVVYRHCGGTGQPSTVKSSTQERVIPGTEMTKDELNEKVMAQIMEHKMFLEGHRRDEEIKRIKEDVSEKVNEKLLKKRNEMEENNLRKSVTFEEDRSEFRDSGMGSEFLSDMELEDFTDEEELLRPLEEEGKEGEERMPRPRRYRRRRRQANGAKPPWRYWKTEEIPTLLESNNYGPYRTGPFQESMPAPPLECRIINKDARGTVTFYNAMSSYKDNMAPHRYEPTVKDSMGYVPRPPTASKPEKQGPGVDICVQLGEAQRAEDLQKQARTEFRRRYITDKKVEWANRNNERELQQLEMDNLKRAQSLDQRQFERQRHLKEYETICIQREAKRVISREIQQRTEMKQRQEADREKTRIEALQANREQREAAVAQKQREAAETRAARQEAHVPFPLKRSHSAPVNGMSQGVNPCHSQPGMLRHMGQLVTERLVVEMQYTKRVQHTQSVREQNQQRHWEAHNRAVEEAEMQCVARENAARQAKVNRTEHFRKLELKGQMLREMKSHVADNNQAIFRASLA